MAKADKNQQVEKKEQEVQEQQEQEQPEVQEQPVLTEAQLRNQKRQEKLQQKKQAKAKENKKDKKSGEPKTNKGKEVVGELKKVTWPTFGTVVKNTLLVIGIVVLITIGLFVVDRLFSWIYQLLVNGAVTNWWF